VFHLANVLVHILAVLVVQKIIILVLSKLQHTNFSETGKRIMGFLGAMVYSLHPLQVEAVSWISGMKDLLCALFGFLSILFWINHLNISQEKVDRQKKKLSFLYYVMSIFAFLLACLSKPQALNVCAMIFVISVGIYRERLSVLFCKLIPFVVVSIPIGWLAKNLQPNEIIHTLTPLWTRPLIALDAFSFYIFKTFFPLNLSFDYSRTPIRVMESGQIYYTWLLPVLITVGAALTKQSHLWLTLISLFFAGFISVSGIVPFYSQNISTTSDRYMLFPMLAVSLAVPVFVAGLLTRYKSRRYLITSGLIAMLVMMLCITYNQISTWRNEKTFLDHNLKINPKSPKLLSDLAKVHSENGELEKAEELLLRSVEIDGTQEKIFNNLGIIQLRLKKYDSARASFSRALEILPSSQFAMFNMGMLEGLQGNHEQAFKWFSAAHRIRPTKFEENLNLANAAIQIGRYEVAYNCLLTCFKLHPDNLAVLLSLVELSTRLERHAEALTYLEKAIKVDLNCEPKLIEQWLNLKQKTGQKIIESDCAFMLYLTNQALRTNQLDKALRMLKQIASQHTDCISAFVRLSSLQEATGQSVEARKTLLEALRSARRLGYRGIVESIEKKLNSRGKDSMHTEKRPR
jgi:tetratricopeptide (TPR) repeat protein